MEIREIHAIVGACLLWTTSTTSAQTQAGESATATPVGDPSETPAADDGTATDSGYSV